MGENQNKKLQCTIVQGGLDAPAHGCPFGTWAVDRELCNAFSRFGAA
jgi:hypothetical protein